MSNTPQIQQENYSDLLNIIVNSNVDKTEKIRMLEVVKQNLQLNRQLKNSNMYQQEQSYLGMLRNPMMMQQPQLNYQNPLMNYQIQPPNPMIFANNGANYQQLYMYEVINYKLNQLLMNVDKINETMTSVSENTIDDLINQVKTDEKKEPPAPELTSTPEKSNSILDTVNNMLGLNNDTEEEDENNEDTDEEIIIPPDYTNNNLVKNITGESSQNNASSTQNNASSTQNNASSTQNNASSTQNNASSTQNNASSTQNNASSTQNNASSTQNNASSTQNNASDTTEQSGGYWHELLSKLL
jgi:hypothetical protein